MHVDWAVIPVAGRGTRMHPLSRAVPKELLPLGRKPVVQHVVEELVCAGMRQLVFVTSPDKPAIRDLLRDANFWRGQLADLTSEEVQLHVVEQKRQIGLGDAVLQAQALVERQPFVVALGDCVIGGNNPSALLKRMLDRIHASKFAAIIALEEVPANEVAKYGIAKIAGTGRWLSIQDLVEKPPIDTAPSRGAIAGRYVLNPDVFSFLAQTEKGRGGEIQLTDAIRGMIRGGSDVVGVPLLLDERRYDVGEFAPYYKAFEAFSAAESGWQNRVSRKGLAAGAAIGEGSGVARGRAFARAGLLGNPSDGYGGKTISCILGNWSAEVRLTPSHALRFHLGDGEPLEFDDVPRFVTSVGKHGYYGGLRLVQAAAKRFFEHCGDRLSPPLQNFNVEYRSDIPRQLGLGGSSAIVIATLRALAAFYGCEIPTEWLPSLALSAETAELGIPAGLQDRVIQTYEGLMYMDFAANRSTTERDMTRGSYERLDYGLLPKLFVAITESSAEPTEVIHSDLRKRFERGDSAVVAAIPRFAEFAELGRDAILKRDYRRLHELMNANFDLRRSICKILPEHLQMVEVARSTGASAKFCGSGGGIVGICEDDSMFEALVRAMATIGAVVVRPQIGIWHGEPSRSAATR